LVEATCEDTTAEGKIERRVAGNDTPHKQDGFENDIVHGQSQSRSTKSSSIRIIMRPSLNKIIMAVHDLIVNFDSRRSLPTELEARREPLKISKKYDLLPKFFEI